jgi:DNA-binding transcriptional LysR family regulator
MDVVAFELRAVRLVLVEDWAVGREPVSALDVRAFVAVCEAGGFRAAAEAYGVSQSSLTRRVRALERRLDLTLVDRSPRRTVPTREGRLLLPSARRLLEQHEGLLETAAVLAERGTGTRGRGGTG